MNASVLDLVDFDIWTVIVMEINYFYKINKNSPIIISNIISSNKEKKFIPLYIICITFAVHYHYILSDVISFVPCSSEMKWIVIYFDLLL